MAGKTDLMSDGTRRLHVSPYDRASSLLLAMLISLGLVVLVLLVTWLTNRIFVPLVAVPVEMAEFGGGGEGGDGRPTGGTQLDDPTADTVPGVEVTTAEVRETLNLVEEAVVAQTTQIDDRLDDFSIAARKGQGDYGTGGGMGGGTGPGRGLGFGPGKGGGPQRQWEVRFLQGSTLDLYARQLDFFGIELGVLIPGGKVAYAAKLSQARPETRTGQSDQEKRYYLTWRAGELQQADRELLARAGVNSTDRIILKFLPPAVESQLAKLEKTNAGSRAGNIRKTRFAIRPSGDGYVFYVLDQSYR